MKLLFGGDLYSGSYGNGKTALYFGRKEFDAVLGGVGDAFRNVTYSFLNLEAPITESADPISKTGPNLKNQPEVVDALLYLKVKGVMLANNHIMDYGEKGLRDTLEILARHNIDFIGAGISEKKRNFLVLAAGPIKAALLNFAENEWITVKGGAGANAVDFANNFADIRRAKEQANVVIVNLHTGNEFNPVPSPWQKKLCRFYVDAGADVVVCHHTHLISGFEYYTGKFIHYGLGNFLFDNGNWKSGSLREGALLEISVDGNSVKALQRIVKLRRDSSRLEAVEEPDLHEQQRINELIQDDAKLQDEYFKFVTRTSAQYRAYIQPYPGFLKRFYKKGLLPSLQTTANKRLLMNLIRCESHREVLIRMLEDQLAKGENGR